MDKFPDSNEANMKIGNIYMRVLMDASKMDLNSPTIIIRNKTQEIILECCNGCMFRAIPVIKAALRTNMNGSDISSLYEVITVFNTKIHIKKILEYTDIMGMFMKTKRNE
ncbi:MAG: hypothetical protein NTY22_03585 [Proteobacteria bacterium]|nr:hypothetical protein [Pseudomonadota bacterium]